MSNKIDFFGENFEDSENFSKEEDQIISTKVKLNNTADKRGKFSKAQMRTTEEYLTYVESSYYEEHVNSEGTVHTVKVDVIRPEVNPYELLRPAYAYGQF